MSEPPLDPPAGSFVLPSQFGLARVFWQIFFLLGYHSFFPSPSDGSKEDETRLLFPPFFTLLVWSLSVIARTSDSPF